MARFIVYISQRVAPVESLLLQEMLERAARARGDSILVFPLNSQFGMAPGELPEADTYLWIGEPGDVPSDHFGVRTFYSTSPDSAISNASGALEAANQQKGTPSVAASRPNRRKIVAITSCPTGVAHTFMAAEALEEGARRLGYEIHVETQGSVGAQNTLTESDIAQADVVLIAADTEVNKGRFHGKKLYNAGTKAAIHDAEGLIETALREGELYGNAQQTVSSAPKTKTRTGAYKHLMTGVSYMIPFVVAGGLLIALGFALGGIYVYEDANKGTLGWTLFTIGAKNGFSLMVPILSGYIAWSIADRPGLAPGMIGGMIASSIGAGFLGGIASGFLAGYVVRWLNEHIRLGRSLDSLKPVLILPLLGTTIVGLLMYYVIGEPVAAVLAAITQWLKGLQGSNAVFLGMLLGSMMAFDMGGPVNKAAYAFSTGLIASQVYAPMAAVMAAGMTPPLALWLATVLFKDRFTTDEREAGKAAAVLGLAFITEGAIPFAAKDPLRVIPALMVGSATAGALSMILKCQLHVPHGGIFVVPIPNAVENPFGYVAAIAVGTVVSAIMLRILKRPAQEDAV